MAANKMTNFEDDCRYFFCCEACENQKVGGSFSVDKKKNGWLVEEILAP